MSACTSSKPPFIRRGHHSLTGFTVHGLRKAILGSLCTPARTLQFLACGKIRLLLKEASSLTNDEPQGLKGLEGCCIALLCQAADSF